MLNRIFSIQKKLQCNEAAIINSDANRFYLTGFASSAGTIFITKSSVDFLIDFRYYERAQKVVKHCNVVLAKHLYQQLQDLIDRYQVNIIYVETSYITVEQFKAMDERLSNCSISLSDRIDSAILALRSIKSADEIAHIKEAQKITDDTFSYILNQIRPGKTEREIMLDMEFFLRKQGSEGVAFDFIVVSGKNSSLPHGVPTDKTLEPGDFVTMDFGAVVGGYRSDMTRTVAIDHVSDLQKHVYDTVLAAQLKVLAAIKPGEKCVDVDRIARSMIYQSGFDGCFGHGLGHSVGIEIHESPSFNTVDETTLQPGMVLTVEPGVYLPDRFGVRIEDMIVVTENGSENLTSSPKELLIL